VLSSIRRYFADRTKGAIRSFSLPGESQARIASYVFVFTYGRSGSTLLMGLLNSIPGYCIRGENNNAVYALYESNRRIEEARSQSLKNSERPGHPWFGLNLVSPEQLRNETRDLVTKVLLHPEPQHQVTGFKEIRFSEKEVPDFTGYLAFIQQTFAPAKIIFNHRNLESVARSGWWKTMPEALSRIEFMEGRFNEVPTSETIFHFSYDAFCADPSYAAGLMSFLGENYDPERVANVLATRHSY
jgi:hypothetical protein